MKEDLTSLLHDAYWRAPTPTRLVSIAEFERVAGSGYFMFDEAGRVLEGTPFGASALGHSYLSPPGSVDDATRALHADDVPSARRLMLALPRAGDIEESIVRVLGTASTKHVLLRARKNENGHTLVVVQDLTFALSYIADRLDESRETITSRVIQVSLASFDEAIDAIHRSTVTALEDGVTDLARQAALRQIVVSARRATELANEVVTSAQQARSVEQLIDIIDLLRGMLPTLREITGEGIEMHVSLVDDLLPIIADPPAVEQLVLSVTSTLTNMIAVGGILEIGAERSTRRAGYSGENQGEDSEPTRRDAIVLSFTGYPIVRSTTESARAHKMSSERIITECRTLADAAGARLVIDRGLDERLSVRVVFRVASPSISVQPSVKDSSPFTGLQSTKVLIVEDESHVRRAVARILRHAGLDAIEVENGRDALALLEERGHEVGLMLTDVVMPHMSGWELAARVRERYPTLRLLMMTGQSFPGDAVVSGVPDLPYIEKPFTLATLLKQVRALLDAPWPASTRAAAPVADDLH
jgi:CheY-like chemotaxis protein